MPPNGPCVQSQRGAHWTPRFQDLKTLSLLLGIRPTRTTFLCDRSSDELFQQIVRLDLIRSIGNDLIGGEDGLFDEPADLMI